MNGIDKAIELVGNQKLLADACGVSPMSVSLWKSNGLPVGRVFSVCAATNWEVTPNDLRPDIYPDPSWLPPEAKEQRTA